MAPESDSDPDRSGSDPDRSGSDPDRSGSDPDRSGSDAGSDAAGAESDRGEAESHTEPARVSFDETTAFSVAVPTTIEDVHLTDLEGIAEIEHEDGHVTRCVIDLPSLVDHVTVYNSLEDHRYGWRRRADTDLG